MLKKEFKATEHPKQALKCTCTVLNLDTGGKSSDKKAWKNLERNCVEGKRDFGFKDWLDAGASAKNQEAW